MSETIELCRKVPIERVEGLSPEVFHARYLSGSGTPVIVTDAMRTWKACSKWTFSLFKARYGSERVVPSIWPGDKHLKVITLGDFIDYVDEPALRSPGFWIDLTTRLPGPAPPEPFDTPLYLTGWRAFSLHPELLEDVQLSPPFVEDWVPLLPAGFRKILDEQTKYVSGGLLIGPAGSVAKLHYDILHTHAYLAQIVGKKRCVLFSPDESALVYGGQVDPDRPDFEKFPLFRRAIAFECTLEPGELLFVPSCWWHHVVALEKSITVNYNFFNRVNFGTYLTAILQALPTILNALEKSPDAQTALGIDWVCRGFDLRP